MPWFLHLTEVWSGSSSRVTIVQQALPRSDGRNAGRNAKVPVCSGDGDRTVAGLGEILSDTARPWAAAARVLPRAKTSPGHLLHVLWARFQVQASVPLLRPPGTDGPGRGEGCSGALPTWGSSQSHASSFLRKQSLQLNSCSPAPHFFF